MFTNSSDITLGSFVISGDSLQNSSYIEQLDIIFKENCRLTEKVLNRIDKLDNSILYKKLLKLFNSKFSQKLIAHFAIKNVRKMMKHAI